MDRPKVILFYDLCRLCLENSGVDDMFNKTGLVQDIYLCTGVKVSSQDNLPRKACMQCLEIVVKAKQLRVLATANETHLKSLFNEDETFIIQDNITEMSHNELTSMSRKSSTDSDKTVQLVIIENDVKENKPSKPLPTQHNTDEAKKISVRKDLFESSGAVTSSTTDATSTESRSKTKHTRMKIENDGDTDYLCEVCQKKFNTWKKFYFHQKTHNRHITCPLDACGKKFATKGDLDKHIRTHTGERPYRCEVCNKSFTQRGSLKAHTATVHANHNT